MLSGGMCPGLYPDVHLKPHRVIGRVSGRRLDYEDLQLVSCYEAGLAGRVCPYRCDLEEFTVSVSLTPSLTDSWLPFGEPYFSAQTLQPVIHGLNPL